jgi:hypothetical protein
VAALGLGRVKTLGNQTPGSRRELHFLALIMLGSLPSAAECP